jgi:hypothetical protein
MNPKQHGHDFAAEHAQLGLRRRRIALAVPLSVAALLLGAGLACAQASDAPISTAGSNAGAAPTTTDPGPSPAQALPRPSDEKQRVQPDIRDLEAAAESGRHAPLLGEYHGEVGAMVGTNGLRGAYGRIVAHPNDKTTVDLRFSTLHENGLPYGYGYGYGYAAEPGWRYRQQGLDYNSFGLGLTLGPAARDQDWRRRQGEPLDAELDPSDD